MVLKVCYGGVYFESRQSFICVGGTLLSGPGVIGNLFVFFSI